MDEQDGRVAAGQNMLNEAGGGPWGGGGSGGGAGNGGGSGGNGGGSGGGGDGLGPRNPWNQPPRKRPGGGGRGPTPSALDELLRRGRGRFGGGLPTGNRSIWGWAAVGLLVLWLFTAFHQVGPQQRGVVTRFGKYSATLQPGVQLTLPLPIDRVTKVNVDAINLIDVGSTAASAQNLMLTGDQNIVDLAYSARWNIRDPQLYLYELKEPEDTIREVAESAMRAEISRVSLNDAIGSQRSQIEARVQQRMQEILDGYRAGVQVQGIAIKQADPPAAVVDAFKSVSAAQQAASADLNQARAYAQQLSAKAEGEAAAFDKVYEQYRLSPVVTRRRMYYETMEDVLAKTDKVVVETPGVTPYLPLPGVVKPQPAPPAAVAR